LITSHVAARKSTEMFCGNIKVLLFEDEEFEDEEYKGLIFENYNIKKIEGFYVKK
jgi:hypothetical protein